jgi:pilus assembly protein Flp/PilA
MKDVVLRLYMHALSLKNALTNEEGQDLIEYALVVALIAFAAIAGMGSLANGINSAFNNVAAKLNSSIT